MKKNNCDDTKNKKYGPHHKSVYVFNKNLLDKTKRQITNILILLLVTSNKNKLINKSVKKDIEIVIN